MSGVRIWEITVLVVALASLAYWWFSLKRNAYALGVLVGFNMCFGWTWLYDGPNFLRLSFNRAAVGGFVWDGRWEPLWTAFSYAALAIPILWFLDNRGMLARRLGLLRYPLFAYAVSLSVQVYEGVLGVGALGVETYHWRPELLWFGAPWLNGLFFVPLLIVLPILFGEAGLDLVARASSAGGSEQNKSTAWTGATGFPAFLTGFASTQAALYVTFLIMVPLLDAFRPWTGVASGS